MDLPDQLANRFVVEFTLNFAGCICGLDHLAGVAAVFLLDAAKLSNRFAGPMVRIRRALAAVVAGDQVHRV